jgi:hypothetical protein
VGEAVDGDFDDFIDEPEFFFGQAEAFVADYERRFSLEAVGVKVLRPGRLFEADEVVTRLLQLPQHRRQGTMNFDPDGVGAVAGDLAGNLRMSAANDTLDARAAGRADDVREIHIAPQRGARDDEFTWASQRAGRLVPLMDEFGHRRTILKLVFIHRFSQINTDYDRRSIRPLSLTCHQICENLRNLRMNLNAVYWEKMDPWSKKQEAACDYRWLLRSAA